MVVPLRVLVVEDRPDDAELMIHELRRTGFEPEWRRVDSPEQYAAALEHAPDLILSDYSLPAMTAPVALQMLQRRHLDIPFVVVTGSISEETAVEMMKLGASDYLLKDRLARLGPAVQAALQQKRMRDEKRHADEALRRFAETQRTLLLELDHRVRNNLASLLSLIDMSRRSSSDLSSFAASISGRVRAMAMIHGLLSQSQFRSLPLRQLVSIIVPPEHAHAVAMNGPDVEIPARQVAAIGIVLHELLTNSAKYGALKKPDGQITLDWSLETADAKRRLTLEWRESGGPRIDRSPTLGAGTQLITGLTRSELRGAVSLSFPADGVSHQFAFVLDDEKDAEAIGSDAERGASV